MEIVAAPTEDDLNRITPQEDPLLAESVGASLLSSSKQLSTTCFLARCRSESGRYKVGFFFDLCQLEFTN